MNQPLPFDPEPIGLLKRRLSKALERIWDAVEHTRAFKADPNSVEYPAMNRVHVFDRLDGVRTVLTRDLDQNGRVLLHASSTIFLHGSKAHGKFIVNRYSTKWQRSYLLASTCELIGRPPADCFLVNVAGKSVHFLFEIRETGEATGDGVPTANAEAVGDAHLPRSTKEPA